MIWGLSLMIEENIYQYFELWGLEFLLVHDGEDDDELCFDVDYISRMLLIDLGDEVEVTI